MILRLPPGPWLKWQVLWDLTELKNQLVAFRYYYGRETAAQLAARVPLLFSLAHPHLLFDDDPLGCVPAQATLVLCAGPPKLAVFWSSHTYLVLFPKDVQHARTSSPPEIPKSSCSPDCRQVSPFLQECEASGDLFLPLCLSHEHLSPSLRYE